MLSTWGASTSTSPASTAPTEAHPRVAAIIPAWNEAETIGVVIDTALEAQLVSEVVVVDNASSDDTAGVAASHGARVVSEPTAGKGQAMRTGVAATGASIVVFLDADLVGLRSRHVDDLVATVLSGQADMACGLFDRGRLANRIFLDGLPVLTGQRALRRELFERLDLRDLRGYRVEAALNSLVAREALRRHDRVLDGLWHRTKEQKLANPAVGFATKVLMLASACWSYARFALSRRLLHPLRRRLSRHGQGSERAQGWSRGRS